jgi:hypothetical protein
MGFLANLSHVRRAIRPACDDARMDTVKLFRIAAPTQGIA